MKTGELIEVLTKCPNDIQILFEKDGIKYEIRGFAYEEKMILLKNG